MRRLLRAGAALALFAAGPARGEDWQLVWSDEFNGPGIDPAHWTLADDCWGGGNAERQCYTPRTKNAAVVDGKLVITARREHTSGPALPIDQRAADPHRRVSLDYSSARLTTRGKAAWRYGRIEVRALLPQGQGSWPAIWMLPEGETYGKWAASGEIDILEAVNLGVPCKTCAGGREDTILGTLHFGGTWPANVHSGDEVHFPAVLEGFHTYAIEWTPERIAWLVDGRVYAERRPGSWRTTASTAPGAPFDQPFHLVLNLAIGGGLAESRGLGGVSPEDFPRRLVIDWVRVWQNGGTPVTPSGQSSIAKGP